MKIETEKAKRGNVLIVRPDGTSGAIPADDLCALAGYIEERESVTFRDNNYDVPIRKAERS